MVVHSLTLLLQRFSGYAIADTFDIALHVVVEVVHLEGHSSGGLVL